MAHTADGRAPRIVAIEDQLAALQALQERDRRALDALYNVSLACRGNDSFYAIFAAVQSELRAIFPMDACYLAICDAQQTNVFRAVLMVDEGSIDYQEDVAAGPLTGQLLQQRRPFLFYDLAATREQLERTPEPFGNQHKRSRAWLGVPLLIGRDAVGVISIQSYQAGLYNEADIDLLQRIGNVVGIILENTHLARQQRTLSEELASQVAVRTAELAARIRELDVIGRIGQLVSASFDLEEMLPGIFEALRQATNAPIFYLAICDATTLIITNAAFIADGRRYELKWLGQPPPPNSMTEWILRRREPLLCHDVQAEMERLNQIGIIPVRISSDPPVRSWVGVPLLGKQHEPIGALSLQDFAPNQYDERTIEVLGQVASHISLGVQKVRLFAAEQAARRTADTLREVARVLNSSFDSQEVLHLILSELRNVIAYDTASIMLLDRNTLRIAAHRGAAGPNNYQQTTFRPSQLSAAWQVVHRRQLLVITDTDASPDWEFDSRSAQTRSWLGVPLIARGNVLGVLNIDSYQFNYFTPRDVEVAQTFASHAAVALENARLYEESVARVEQELDIARRIQSNLFPRTLPLIAGLTVAARCLPARETGGDFYDFIPLSGSEEAPGALGLVVGDASGKSIPGAMLMAIARSIARSEARDHQTAEMVIRETNYWVVRDVPPHAFVALCYATFDLQRRQLALANAGQLTPLRRRPDGLVEYLYTPEPTLPLGVLPDVPYVAIEIPLFIGDLLVFYTDGIVEARDSAGQLFGFERLEALLHEYGDLAPTALIDHILNAVGAFMGGAAQHDDMTIVVARVEE